MCVLLCCRKAATSPLSGRNLRCEHSCTQYLGTHAHTSFTDRGDDAPPLARNDIDDHRSRQCDDDACHTRLEQALSEVAQLMTFHAQTRGRHAADDSISVSLSPACRVFVITLQMT